jgi:hypothetical protein
MANLFDIESGILELIERGFNDACVNEDGEIDFDLAQQFLEALEGEREEKLESIALYVKELYHEADAIAQEELKLKKRRQAKEKKAERLEEYLKSSLLGFGDKKFETPRVVLSFRTSKAVVVTDETKLDKKYMKAKVVVTVDKTAIKDALDKGEVVEGAAIEEKQNLQIK